jgi:hypothetical protein
LFFLFYRCFNVVLPFFCSKARNQRSLYRKQLFGKGKRHGILGVRYVEDRAGYVKCVNRQADYLTSLHAYSPCGLNGESCSTRSDGYRRHRNVLSGKVWFMAKTNNDSASVEAEKLTRKTTRRFQVPVFPEEEEIIKQLASSVGLSVSAYLRNVGLGYQVQGILDNKRVEELARINGDLGRLGGLLKLWLTDDVRTAKFGEATILAVLSKIADTQGQMQNVMREIVLPRSQR